MNSTLACRKDSGENYYRRHLKSIGECFDKMDFKSASKEARTITVHIGPKESYKIEDGEKINYLTRIPPHFLSGGYEFYTPQKGGPEIDPFLHQHWDCFDEKKSYFISVDKPGVYLLNGNEIPATYFIECVKQ